MQEQKLERITPAQAGLDPQCIINMMDRMEKEHINITSFMVVNSPDSPGYILTVAFNYAIS